MYSLTRFVDNSRYSIEFLSNWSHPRNNNPLPSPLFSFLTAADYAKWQGIAHAERASSAKTFISAQLSNGASLLFSFPSTGWNSTAGLPECFIVRVPFKRAQRSRVSWLLRAPPPLTDHSPLSFLVPGIWDRRAWRKAKRPSDYECTPATRGVAPFWSPVWPPFSIIFRPNLSTRSSGPVSAWNNAGSMVSPYFFLLIIIIILADLSNFLLWKREENFFSLWKVRNDDFLFIEKKKKNRRECFRVSFDYWSSKERISAWKNTGS